MTDPGDIVKVRLSGTNIGKLADAIAASPGWTVLERSQPYPNRRDPGERIYLTVICEGPVIDMGYLSLPAEVQQEIEAEAGNG